MFFGVPPVRQLSGEVQSGRVRGRGGGKKALAGALVWSRTSLSVVWCVRVNTHTSQMVRVGTADT